MSLPTKINIQTLDYSYRGGPWARVAAKSGIDLDGLDYSYQGEPFWGTEDAVAGVYSVNVTESIGVADTKTVTLPDALEIAKTESIAVTDAVTVTLISEAFGLSIIYGSMGIINLAHGEFVMLGAYAAWVFHTYLGLGLLASLVPIFLVVAAFGWVIERYVLSLLNNRPLDTILATWGVGIMLQQAVHD